MLPAENINIGIDGAVGKGDSITFRIGESSLEDDCLISHPVR